MEQQNPIQDTPSVFNPPPNHPAQSPSQPQFDPNHHQQNLQHLQQHHQQGSDEPLTEKLGYNTSDYKARFFRSKAKFERANAATEEARIGIKKSISKQNQLQDEIDFLLDAIAQQERRKEELKARNGQ